MKIKINRIFKKIILLMIIFISPTISLALIENEQEFLDTIIYNESSYKLLFKPVTHRGGIWIFKKDFYTVATYGQESVIGHLDISKPTYLSLKFHRTISERMLAKTVFGGLMTSLSTNDFQKVKLDAMSFIGFIQKGELIKDSIMNIAYDPKGSITLFMNGEKRGEIENKIFSQTLVTIIQ